MSHAATCTRRIIPPGRARLLTWLIACASLLWPDALPGQTVAVRHAEGLVHGFLSLRTLDGTPLADGDLIQTSRGDRVTSTESSNRPGPARSSAVVRCAIEGLRWRRRGRQ
jgi:hypothetical protein